MLGSGIMPLLEAQQAGLRVALGTDSANTGGRHDLFEAMRLALMLPRIGEPDHTRWPHGRDVLDMATRNGAAVLGLEDRAGRIAAGQLADLVLVRCRSVSTLALAPGQDVLVQHGGPEAVDSVMVDGRWVMRGQVLLAFDEAAALADAEAAMHCMNERLRSWRCWTGLCRLSLRRFVARIAQLNRRRLRRRLSFPALAHPLPEGTSGRRARRRRRSAAYRASSHRRLGSSGISRMSMPRAGSSSASSIAWAKSAPTGMAPASPTPLTPSSL